MILDNGEKRKLIVLNYEMCYFHEDAKTVGNYYIAKVILKYAKVTSSYLALNVRLT